MCNLNVIVVLEFISRDLYLLFAIGFSSKFQNSVFYHYMRPKSGLKFPRPFHFSHYKSMETESCHSNQSSYLTGTKNNCFVEANARNIYAKSQLHKANSF